jgi:PAS domain S-box-containing protein
MDEQWPAPAGRRTDAETTGVLASRPRRAPDYAREAAALRQLVRHLSSEDLPQQIVDLILVLCRAHSAGLSSVEPNEEPRLFRWLATAGPFAPPPLDAPREDGPFADLERSNAVLLFERQDPAFPGLRTLDPPVEEAIVAPWFSGGEAVGMLWAVAHGPDRRFDAEDARLLQSLLAVAATAWHLADRKAAAERERTAVRAALEASEARLRLIVESVGEYAIFTLDRGGAIATWHAGAERIFGLSAEEAVGQPIALLFTPEDRAAGVPQLELQRAATVGHAEDERWHLRADGRRFFADGVMFPLRVDGQLTGYVKVARDVTDRKRHEEALEERVRERTADLRTAVDALQEEVRSRGAAEDQIKALFRELVNAQEEERKRIARDIHDQAGQQLTALRITLASLATMIDGDGRAADIAGRAQQLAAELDGTIDRLTWQLRPPALDHLGLASAVAQLVVALAERSGIQADFDAAALAGVRLDPAVETHLYHLTQEALHNVVKHARATRVTVYLGRREQHVVLIVEDDGAGFDPAGSAAGAPARRGLGLTSMRERAALAGGEMEIESSPGSGTTVFIRVPFAAGPA